MDALVASVLFVGRFSESLFVVFEVSPLYHDFQLPFVDAAPTLASVVYQSNRLNVVFWFGV